MLTGKVTQYQWCSVMGCVLEMDLPWRTLRSKLARCDENGMVAYETTFEEMRIYHRYSGVCLIKCIKGNKMHSIVNVKIYSVDNSYL